MQQNQKQRRLSNDMDASRIADDFSESDEEDEEGSSSKDESSVFE